MNKYYQILYYLKELLESDPLLNSVTHGVVETIDNDKKTIFPMAHLLVNSVKQGQGVLIFDVTIHCLDIRNISKIYNTDKFLRNDNEIDNMNTTLSILNLAVQKLRNTYNDYDIELLEEPTFNPVSFEFTNILDGWNTNLVLSISNTDISVCNG